jgi:hypothetical protein
MFEKYTFSARRVVREGQLSAFRAGSKQLNATHLTIGWLKEPVDPVTAPIADRIRRDLITTSGSGMQAVGSQELPLGRDAWCALQDAERLRQRHQHASIGNLHVLWGLLRNAPREVVMQFTDEGIHADWVERLLLESEATK